MSTFVGVWPVLDDGRPMAVLVDEAYEELPRLAWETGCVVVETPRWSTRSADDRPTGYVEPSPCGLYLVAEAECRPRTGVL